MTDENTSLEMDVDLDVDEAVEALKKLNRMAQALENKLNRIAEGLEALPVDWESVDFDEVENADDLIEHLEDKGEGNVSDE